MMTQLLLWQSCDKLKWGQFFSYDRKSFILLYETSETDVNEL